MVLQAVPSGWVASRVRRVCRESFLQRATKRLEWERVREREVRDAEAEAEKERVAYQSIDWWVRRKHSILSFLSFPPLSSSLVPSFLLSLSLSPSVLTCSYLLPSPSPLFSSPLSLFLPFSLSLSFCLAFALILFLPA